MTSGFKIRKTATETIYVLEDGTSGGTSSGAIASIAMPVGAVIKRTPGKQKATKKAAKGNLVVSESQYKWSDYESVPSMADRLSIFEAFVEHNFNLRESNDGDTTAYFLKLNSLSSMPVENNQYIVTLLGLVNNRILEMQPVELVTFLKQDGSSYSVKLNNGKISKFPTEAVSKLSVVNTFFFESEADYDKFRSVVALKFNKSLSDFVDDAVDEDADPCWKGYKKIGNKMKNGKSVPNCVKNERVDAALEDQSTAETFDNPYKAKWEKSEYGDQYALVNLPDGTNLSIKFSHENNNEWQVEFHRNNSQEVTGEGDAQKIFATVLNAMQKFIKKQKPARLKFAASKLMDPTIYHEPDERQPNPASRAKLYDRLVQRYAKALGYRAFRADTGRVVIYELSRIKQGVAEADKHSVVGKIQRGHELKKKVDSTFKDIGAAQKQGDHSEASKAFRKHERYANLERPGTWTKSKEQGVAEEWSQQYKSGINCSHTKGFSQKAHCAGKKKHNEDVTMEATCPDCGMCQTHSSLDEIKKGNKDSNGFTKCWSGHHAAGTKKGKNGGQVRNCVPNEGVDSYTARLQEALDNKIASSPPPRNFVAKNAKTAGAGAHSDKSKTIPRHQKHKDNFKESEGSPEGVPHVSKKLLQHIVQQIGTDGVQALIKSLKWGDGAAEELLTLITQNLKQSAHQMKEASLQEKIPKGADVDYYIKDFSKSNAPQFKNKTAEKKKRMAIAAYYASKQK